MSNRIAIGAVFAGSIVILALTALAVKTSIETQHGPRTTVVVAMLFFFPPSVVAIAWGLFKGIKQLPGRGYPISDVVILSGGGAIGLAATIWLLLATQVLPAISFR